MGEKYSNENKNNKKVIIMILIVIIILLLMFLLGYKVGKIGYQETSIQPGESTVNGITLMESDMKAIKNNQLNIFNNEEFNNQKIIAPHSKGTYKFLIKNQSNGDVIYNIKFNDEMKAFVNMKYKLKMDNIYIKGNSETYTTIDDLNIDNITVLKDSINIYTLEWYWDDNDELDTYVGSQDEDNYYKIGLEIEASEYQK